MCDHLPEDLVGSFTWRSCGIIYLKILWYHLPGDLVVSFTWRSCGIIYPKILWYHLPGDLVVSFTWKSCGIISQLMAGCPLGRSISGVENTASQSTLAAVKMINNLENSVNIMSLRTYSPRHEDNVDQPAQYTLGTLDELVLDNTGILELVRIMQLKVSYAREA